MNHPATPDTSDPSGASRVSRASHASHASRACAAPASAARRARHAMLALGLACLTGGAPVQAQERWPTKPVRLIVTFTPGGTSDLVARLLGPKYSAAFGQSFVVDNVPGAGGIIGADRAAKAAPDGYTLVISSVGPHGIGPTLNRNIKYDAVADFTHVALLGATPHVLLVNPKFAARNLADLTRLARAAPGKINYASGGTGTINHIMGELIKSAGKFDMVHIPYKGSAPAMIDLLANTVPVGVDALPANIGRIKSGELRALAISSRERSPLAPEIPTFVEQGLPDVVVENWVGLSGPAHMPDDISRRLADETAKILTLPDVQDKLREWGVAVTYRRGADFTSFVRADVAKWRPVILASGAQVD